MASLSLIFPKVFILLYVLLASFTITSEAIEDERKVYIVYMGALPSENNYSPLSHHQNLLQQVTGLSSAKDFMIRSYGRSLNGFAANLTESERERLVKMKEVVSVFPTRVVKLHTTHSWDFIGLGEGSKHIPEVESDLIVGVLDGGIWPEIPSFTDKGFGPPPQKWKGTCNGGSNFTCNKKVIGARYYVDKSARDPEGHGSHTASTAAGNRVENISFFNLAQGTVRGGVPSARISVYKVCNSGGCASDAVLAAFDDAIADGVDIISLSLGGLPTPIDRDPIAIGAFHAMEKGILTVNSAGNSGEYAFSTASVAPWLMSVAASSTDRAFITKIVLGNGKTLVGRSIDTFKLNGTKYPFAYGKTLSTLCSEERAKSCDFACFLIPNEISLKGKIAVCNDRGDGLLSPSITNRLIGVIYRDDTDDPEISSVPQSSLSDSDFEYFESYLNSTQNPFGTILKTETIKDKSAPLVVSFSSRGPNIILDDILKPDITAPGVNILAAYSPISVLGDDSKDKRRSNYTIMSGTSMACPHVTGAAAYIKTLHRDWSPSAVKSALMTTAWVMNASSSKGAEFAYGSGHVNPKKAVDPGLVYETTMEDYLNMFCTMNYSVDIIRKITGEENISCSERGSKSKLRDLNYPSMAANVASPSQLFNVSFSRTVTNVGTPNSTYEAQVIKDNPKLNIKVEPEKLSFKSLGEKKSFKVTISGNGFTNKLDQVTHVSASLVWSDGSNHIVRSPIVVYSSSTE